MTPEQKEWIDNASYIELLRRWRFSDTGDVIFQEEAGEYYKAVMNKRREEVGPSAHVAASKSIGWDK